MRTENGLRGRNRGGTTSGTREWADHNVNCIRGCYNDCRYCYARIMAVRFGRARWQTWSRMKVRDDVLNGPMKRFRGRVMFPSSHDIVDMPPFKEACMVVLGMLLSNGNQVLITTKPRINVIKEIDRRYHSLKSLMQFRFTITSIHDETLAFWEPNAPEFGERLRSLRYAFRKGYKTSVSVEPFLDYDPTELIERVSPLVTESIWIGRMNYIRKTGLSRMEKRRYEEIRKNYETGHLAEVCQRLRAHPLVRFKDSVRIQLRSSTLKKGTIPTTTHVH
jgi:DNA repair photolyase